MITRSRESALPRRRIAPEPAGAFTRFRCADAAGLISHSEDAMLIPI
jgi:hypothetical protein